MEIDYIMTRTNRSLPTVSALLTSLFLARFSSANPHGGRCCSVASFTLMLILLIMMVPSPMVHAQQNIDIKFTQSELSLCDADGKITLQVEVSEVPNQKTLSLFFRKSDGSYSTASVNLSEQGTATTYSIKFTDPTKYDYDPAVGYRDLTFTLTDASMSSAVGTGVPLNIVEPSSIEVHFLGTPDNTLPADDPSSCAIIADDVMCGLDAHLKANNAWGSVSTYEWSCTGAFSIEANGDTARLIQKRNAQGLGSAEPIKSNVTLTQTVGGLCQTSVTKTITLNGLPTGTLSRDPMLDASHLNVIMCSSIPDENDPGRHFGGVVTLRGVAPFTATLSTGDEFTFDHDGYNKFSNATGHKSEDVVISHLVDGNGCVAGPDGLSGSITVIDRKPMPYFGTDTINSNTKEIGVTVTPTDESDWFLWGMGTQYNGLDCGIESYGTSSARVHSRMNTTVGYWVVEVNNHEGLDCPSDTAYISVVYDMPFRYPNAISPNGDGKNDKLIIEGMPENNLFMVLDERGKEVFKRANYRNDWGAEELEDGYYIYIFKGEGVKTVKEMLVIKRTFD